MKITNLGGATAIIEYRGKRMLFDPWLDDGIFHGSWFHWPPVALKANDLGRFDYVYISHIHEDHCSAGTIKYINNDAEIIIMDKQPNFVANFLRLNQFNFSKIHLIPPRKGLQLAEDLFIDMIEADPSNEMSYAIDSSIVVQWGGKTIFNANDCQPHTDGIDYLNKNYPKIDLALLPYSGGSGYPSCYINLSDEEKLIERDRIIKLRALGFISNIKKINPRYAMPFADQYIVGGSRSNFNQYIAHPDSPGSIVQYIVEAGLTDKLLMLNSGQSFDLVTDKKIPAIPYKNYTNDEKNSYLKTIANTIYDHEKIKFNAAISSDRILRHARQRLWLAQIKRNSFPIYNLVIEFTDSNRRFEINLSHENIKELANDDAPHEPYLRISCSDTLMIMMLIGHVSWNIADAALFLDYERKPNIYDSEIYFLINMLKI